MRDVLAIILGGGRGTRLFPLTHSRSKPAVPIGGKYRLIDIPISSCLHSELRRILVLTQFNSASLNRHIGLTYRLDQFSEGFVEILAAEQTPDSSHWFQGTADAVRQARRHFEQHDADYYLILAGDHLYRMDYAELVEAHTERGADITIAAQPVTPSDATEMGIFRFDRAGQIVAFEEKPTRARLGEMGGSLPTGGAFLTTPPEKPFVASMGIYVFSRQVLLEVLEQDGIDFGKEIIPAALGRYRVNAFLHRGYWADVGTIGAYYDANLMLTKHDTPFRFHDPKRPIFTRARTLPPARVQDCTLRDSILTEGCTLENGTIIESVLGVRAVVRRAPRSHAASWSVPIFSRRKRMRWGLATRRAWVSAATSRLTAPSWTRTPGSATGAGWSTSRGFRKPTATAGTSVRASSSCPREASSRRGRRVV